MGDEVKDAMAWLDEAGSGHETMETNIRHRAIIKRLLARPVMPEIPDPEALRVMRIECEGESYTPAQAAYQAYRALYAHLTRPATKTVEVWHVELADRAKYDGGRCSPWKAIIYTRDMRDEADELAAALANNPDVHACIRVTGPHQQEVPA